MVISKHVSKLGDMMSIMQIVITMIIWLCIMSHHDGAERSHHPDPPQSLSNLRHTRSRSQAQTLSTKFGTESVCVIMVVHLVPTIVKIII